VQGKYTIELFHDGGERAGIERVLVQHHSLATHDAPRVVSGNAATFTVIRGFGGLLSLVYSEYCHEAEA